MKIKQGPHGHVLTDLKGIELIIRTSNQVSVSSAVYLCLHLHPSRILLRRGSEPNPKKSKKKYQNIKKYHKNNIKLYFKLY